MELKVLLFLALLQLSCCQIILDNAAKWCCQSEHEYAKCLVWSDALRAYNVLPRLACVLGQDKFDCFRLISRGDADMMAADAGDTYTAGKHYSLIPIMSEKTPGGGSAGGSPAVAVIKASSSINNLEDLRGRNSCHPSVGDTAGWNIPISTLIKQERMDVTDCNNHVRTAARFFGKMCAPDALNQQYNPTGDNPTSSCDLCSGRYGETFCTSNDPYSGYFGAMTCLVEGPGEVAFVRSTAVDEYLRANPRTNPNDLMLLCPNGVRSPIGQLSSCSWGTVPDRAILTSFRKASSDRRSYEELLKRSATLFGGSGTPSFSSNMTFSSNISIKFSLFNSLDYKGHDLLFKDQTIGFESTGSRNNYHLFLGKEALDQISWLYICPLSIARWCVISEREKDKCRRMKNAFSAKNIKPDLDCVIAGSTIECMDKIRNGRADLITLDAGDAYIGARYHDLVPIAMENYGLSEEVFYAVAIANRLNLQMNLYRLKGKRSCHTAVGDTAGWIVPVATLLARRELWMDRPCHIPRAVGEYFLRSCAPGALSDAYNPLGSNPRALCMMCYAKGADFCSRSHVEMFFGDSGVIRCLSEGRGDVGFTRHTAVTANTDGRNPNFWARFLRDIDFELLCPDGSRRPAADYENCNMGKFPSNMVMVSGSRDRRARDFLWNMLNYAQQYFGSDYNNDFAMFKSEVDYPDMIFKDAAVKLVPVPYEHQRVESIVGKDFVAMMHQVDPRICNAATWTRLSWMLLILSTFLATSIPR